MFENLKSLYKFAVEKIIEVEGQLKGKTGLEKRDAVVEYLIGLFNVKAIPDFIETPVKRFVLQYAVDQLVEKLNWVTDWDFGEVELTPAQEEILAEAPFPVVAQTVSELPASASIDEKLAALAKNYGVDNKEKIDPWPDCIAFVLAREGGYVDHPVDKGGETNMGITGGTLATAYAQGLVKHNDVKNLTHGEAESIYKANYWGKYEWGKLPWPVCLALFDATVHHGPGGMAAIAQRTGNAMGASPALDVDGKYGPKTRASIGELAGGAPEAYCEEFLRQRKDFFDAIIARTPSQQVFQKGWHNRLKELAGKAGVKSPV